ncbi:MAG: mechanosensitive ion channel protein [Acidimicrobiia bacterium]|nr:MAG: mechanosensitive ion channel protein [Acidimicrobiia bacterium]
MEPILQWWESTSPTLVRLLLSLGLLAALVLVRWLVLRAIHVRIEGQETYFRARKWVAYVVTAVGLLGLVQIWFGGVGGLTTYLGILSAGVAIALADVLENLAAWFYIVARKPFVVGDRIEIEGVKGDVVDIRAFRFSMLEVGNWVGAEQSTGRLIHVPNGKVFTSQLANYTEGFPYIWEELPVLVTFESDWRRAEELVAAALRAHAPATGPIQRAIERAGRTYLIRYRHLDPTTYVAVEDSGVKVVGRYLVPVRERRRYADEIWRAVLDGIAAEPAVELAYPTHRTVITDTLRVVSVTAEERGDGG